MTDGTTANINISTNQKNHSVTTCPGEPSMAATEEKSANMFTCAKKTCDFDRNLEEIPNRLEDEKDSGF